MVQFTRYKFKDRCIVAQQTLARKQDILYNYHGRNMNELCKTSTVGMFGINKSPSIPNQKIEGAFAAIIYLLSHLNACLKH
jgi:hypothetical protein